MSDAETFKTRGNESFKNGRFFEAIELWSEAINLAPTAALYSNRAFAYIRTEAFGAALQDASNAIELDPSFVKAYYRRASANMALNKFKESLKDYQAVAKACPDDKDAQEKFKECDKIVKKIAFEKAIAVDNEKPLVDTVKNTIASIVVEESYSGPHLKDGVVTKEFMDALLPYLKDQKKLHRKYVLQILTQAYDFLSGLLTVPNIPIPPGGKITVCGDTHGQFYDVLNLFEINGLPSESNPYLFNGDFVDRGSFSVEVILTFLGFRLLYKNAFFLSRGNHETINMNKMYGFEGEVKAKYNQQANDLFTDVFNCLPLGHTIQNAVFVVHGGLFSKDGVKVEDLRKLSRRCQPPDEGPMVDMLWSDPQMLPGRSPSKRGTGTQFGPDVTARFLADNGLKLLIRSHEVKPDGYEVMHDGKCITIFSAPNYCDQMGNKGAFITLHEDLEPKFTTFTSVPHPNVQPMAYASQFGNLFGFM